MAIIDIDTSRRWRLRLRSKYLWWSKVNWPLNFSLQDIFRDMKFCCHSWYRILSSHGYFGLSDDRWCRIFNVQFDSTLVWSFLLCRLFRFQCKNTGTSFVLFANHRSKSRGCKQLEIYYRDVFRLKCFAFDVATFGIHLTDWETRMICCGFFFSKFTIDVNRNKHTTRD